MTDHPDDTPKSLRALADDLACGSYPEASDAWVVWNRHTLKAADAALRRAADRLDRVAALALPLDLPEATRDALAAWLQDSALVRVNILTGRIAKPGDLVWLHDTNGPVADAIDAARRAGAEEMRAACLDLSRGCQHDLGFDREHGPLGCALDAEGRGWCMCAGLYAAIRALPLPGDQP